MGLNSIKARVGKMEQRTPPPAKPFVLVTNYRPKPGRPMVEENAAGDFFQIHCPCPERAYRGGKRLMDVEEMIPDDYPQRAALIRVIRNAGQVAYLTINRDTSRRRPPDTTTNRGA